MSFVCIGHRAAGGAGDPADHSLGATLAEHFAGFGIVGVDDYAVWNIAPKLGIGVGGWVQDFSVYAADASFGVTGLNGGIGIPGNTDSPHGEETRRSLGVGGTKTPSSGSATERHANFAGFQRDDLHPLGAGVNDVNPLGIVVWMAGSPLRGDRGLDPGPLFGDGLFGGRPGGGSDGAGLENQKQNRENDGGDLKSHAGRVTQLKRF